MHQLKLGVIARSRKENEQRLPIHPAHFERIDPGLRELISLQQGYGEAFGVSDGRWRLWWPVFSRVRSSSPNETSSCLPSRKNNRLNHAGYLWAFAALRACQGADAPLRRVMVARVDSELLTVKDIARRQRVKPRVRVGWDGGERELVLAREG